MLISNVSHQKAHIQEIGNQEDDHGEANDGG